MSSKSIEKMEEWIEEFRKNYEYHLYKASEWLQEIKNYEKLIEQEKKRTRNEY